MISFESDYIAGAHPEVLKRLVETNMESLSGYGTDRYCESAKEKIRKACGLPEAQVEFLVGGTQTNSVIISTMLADYEGVIAAKTGHISTHEAGAIEYTGHEVLELPQKDGKIRSEDMERFLRDFYVDGNHEHMTFPGMVYISHPTEYGTLYTRKELEDLRSVCSQYHMALYLDGARLAYALACEQNNVTLQDLASCCDAFYIGGTKCGALFGEAVVIPDPHRIPAFFTIIKQHGALFAKGRLLGLQFDTLFTDGLYERIGIPAVRAAQQIQKALVQNGYQLYFESPTNQIFCVVENRMLEKLGQKVEYSFWEKYDDSHTVIRFAADWGTTQEETDELIALLASALLF